MLSAGCGIWFSCGFLLASCPVVPLAASANHKDIFVPCFNLTILFHGLNLSFCTNALQNCPGGTMTLLFCDFPHSIEMDLAPATLFVSTEPSLLSGTVSTVSACPYSPASEVSSLELFLALPLHSLWNLCLRCVYVIFIWRILLEDFSSPCLFLFYFFLVLIFLLLIFLCVETL